MWHGKCFLLTNRNCSLNIDKKNNTNLFYWMKLNEFSRKGLRRVCLSTWALLLLLSQAGLSVNEIKKFSIEDDMRRAADTYTIESKRIEYWFWRSATMPNYDSGANTFRRRVNVKLSIPFFSTFLNSHRMHIARRERRVHRLRFTAAARRMWRTTAVNFLGRRIHEEEESKLLFKLRFFDQTETKVSQKKRLEGKILKMCA